MIRKALFVLAALGVGQLALADGVIELPANSKFIVLKVKTDNYAWKSIDIPKMRGRKITLPAGEYSYSLSLKSAVSKFRGKLTVTDGSHQYIHRAITPDRQSVYSWVSTSGPRTDAYKTETKEHFCMGVVGYGSDKPQYMLDACAELVEANNARGLFATGHMYSEGKGGVQQNRNTASDYYMRAYELGSHEAGVSYFLLHQHKPEGVEVLLDVASQGDVWAIGVAGQVLSASDDPKDHVRSREFAQRSLDLQDPVGFRTLAQLALRREHEGPEYVIESAAFFNLYNINLNDYSSLVGQFKSLLEEALVSEDMPEISAKTEELAEQYLNTGLYFLVDTSIFERYRDQGELSLTVNNQFSMQLDDADSRFALELMPSEKRHRATLLADGAFVDETTFNLGETGDAVHCLILDPQLGSLQIATNSTDETCPVDVEGTKSMWRLLNQDE